MTSQELLENYGKAANTIKNFLQDQMIGSLNDELPENFQEFVKQQTIDNQIVATMIDFNARNLFDLFDTFDILINICPLSINSFSVKVNNEEEEDKFTNRRDADIFATRKAIKLLNDKL